MHSSGQGATLPRRRSRIPTATGGARHQAAARQGAEAELGTDSVDERLETLLHLLGGSRPGSIVNRYRSHISWLLVTTLL